MQVIRLRKQVWEYDSSITLGPPGGFGTVFLGRGEGGEQVAVKKLHLSASSAGNRELTVSEELEGKTFSHIIPYYDSGIDAESMDYYVVMAKADESLQQLIDKRSVSEREAVKILKQLICMLLAALLLRY